MSIDSSTHSVTIPFDEYKELLAELERLKHYEERRGYLECFAAHWRFPVIVEDAKGRRCKWEVNGDRENPDNHRLISLQPSLRGQMG